LSREKLLSAVQHGDGVENYRQCECHSPRSGEYADVLYDQLAHVGYDYLQCRVALLQRAHGLLQLRTQRPALLHRRRQPRVALGAGGGLCSGALGCSGRSQGLFVSLVRRLCRKPRFRPSPLPTGEKHETTNEGMVPLCIMPTNYASGLFEVRLGIRAGLAVYCAHAPDPS